MRRLLGLWMLAAAALGAALTSSCGPGQDPAVEVPTERDAATASPFNDWSFYRYDVLGQSYVDQPLTAAQARGLTTAWTFRGAGSAANPIVVGSTVYITESNGFLVAVDVTTGQLRWSQPIGITAPTSCSPFTGRPVGAAAVVGSSVFVPGGDGKVHAFDKDSGQPRWSTSIASVADNEFLWASAFPLRGRIYVGVATRYEPICGSTPGRVVALDQVTGAVAGTWWVNPQHEPGGTVWTQPAYDAATNRLFFTTGQGQEGVDLASQPLAQAFVAIDADTMQPVDWYQPVTSPFTADYDFGASPTLFDTADGRHLIAAANKNGFVYALDRDHLSRGVVWSYQVSVPGDSPDLGTSTIVSAAHAHGTLFVGGGQTPDGFAGAVVALDPATGAVRWKFHPDGFVLAALTAIGDVVVAQATRLPDRTGRLYVLDQATGAPLFQLSTPGPLYAQPTFAAGRLFVSDASGVVYALQPPAPSGPAAIDFGAGFTATGLQRNGSAALSGTRLRLTNGGAHQAASAFYTTPVSVQSFTTDFSFQLTNPGADGITFTLQGIGPSALGPGGGGLGYGPDSPAGAPGIGKSVAVKFDLYNNAGEGTNSTGLYTNGASPTVPSVNLSGVNLHSGDVFNVHVTYDGTNLAMTIRNASTGATASVTFPIDIPATIGSTTAYAGFTAGTGGLTATQDILSWTYGSASGSPPPPDFALSASPSSVTTSAGGSTTSTIGVTAQNGFSGTVSLSASGIPAGATATLNPTSVNGAGSSTLTLSAGTAAAGTYTVTVTGRAGSLAHSTSVSWTISTVAGPSLAFADDFNRTTGLGGSWSVQYGSFTTDGTYAVSGTPPRNGNWASLVPAIGTNDYSVVADLVVPSGSLYSGIVARSRVAGAFDQDLYAAQISTSGTVNLYRRNAWTWTQLGSVAAGIVAGTRYRLELVATGSSPVHLEVWLDGTRRISYDDSSSSRITGGVPGLENYNAGVRYDSFAVYRR